MHSARLGCIREEAEAHSIEKPGVIEIKARLEVRRIHIPRLTIRLIEDRFFSSAKLRALARLGEFLYGALIIGR